MGGGGSTEHHYHTTTVYEVPPETKKTLQEQTERIASLEEEAKKKGDPQLFEENSKKMFDEFVEKIPALKLSDIIDKKTGEEHIGFIGPISTGKTSMINVLFDKSLPVALGHITESCEVVHQYKNKVVWDVCGKNNDYKFYNPENLSFLKCLDKCIILFENDVMMISDILKVINKINPDSMIIVRTKVDQHTAQNARTVDEEKKLDMEKVNNCIGRELVTYCVSSHNIRNGNPERFDWDAIKKILEI